MDRRAAAGRYCEQEMRRQEMRAAEIEGATQFEPSLAGSSQLVLVGGRPNEMRRALRCLTAQEGAAVGLKERANATATDSLSLSFSFSLARSLSLSRAHAR